MDEIPNHLGWVFFFEKMELVYAYTYDILYNIRPPSRFSSGLFSCIGPKKS